MATLLSSSRWTSASETKHGFLKTSHERHVPPETQDEIPCEANAQQLHCTNLWLQPAKNNKIGWILISHLTQENKYRIIFWHTRKSYFLPKPVSPGLEAGYTPRKAFQNRLPDTGCQGVNTGIAQLYQYHY